MRVVCEKGVKTAWGTRRECVCVCLRCCCCCCCCCYNSQLEVIKAKDAKSKEWISDRNSNYTGARRHPSFFFLSFSSPLSYDYTDPSDSILVDVYKVRIELFGNFGIRMVFLIFNLSPHIIKIPRRNHCSFSCCSSSYFSSHHHHFTKSWANHGWWYFYWSRNSSSSGGGLSQTP